ncbi:MAG: CoA transferase [Actinomycetota bacterium]
MLDLLSGIRVVDLTTIILGPYGTQILGDLGADVIKVETPNGDLFRAARPGHSTELGAGFLNFNRNKRSVSLDLKSDAGRADLDRLLASADALVHNMRPAAAERLGLGLDAVRERHPHLVYVRSPGFDQDGPGRDRPAYDDVVQAASGLAGLMGDHLGGEPRYVPSVVADKIGGLHLTIAVLAGLLGRERSDGAGRRIEAPMFESLVSFLLAEHLAGHTFEPPLGPPGYERITTPRRRPFRTADGWLGVLPYDGGHWQRMLGLLGRDDLAAADWVLDDVRRSERIAELYGVLADGLVHRTTDEWVEAISGLDVPCAPVASVDDLLTDEHLTAVGMFRLVDHPTEGTLRQLRSPFRDRDGGEEPDRPVPRLGEHNVEVLDPLDP